MLDLFEFDGPVGFVEERFPRGVAFAVESHGDERVALGLDGLFDEFHVGLLGGAAALAGVAACAGADEVLPGVWAVLGAGFDMVYGEFGGVEVLAAVLAAVVVSCEEVAAIEFDALLGEFVVADKTDDSRHGDIEADGFDPVVVVGLVLFTEFGELGPS